MISHSTTDKSVPTEKSNHFFHAPAKHTPDPSLKNDCVYAIDPKKERGALR
jgi:hypothetical protein